MAFQIRALFITQSVNQCLVQPVGAGIIKLRGDSGEDRQVLVGDFKAPLVAVTTRLPKRKTRPPAIVSAVTTPIAMPIKARPRSPSLNARSD